MKRKHLVVYTAICGGYDSLKHLPDSWQSAADCIAYVDEARAASWTIRPLTARHPDPCRRAKVHKILPEDLFEEYEYSIWIDGSVIPKPEVLPTALIEGTLANHDLAVFRHRNRRCLYVEAEACIAAGKDQREIIEDQVARYRSVGYPPNNGLHECTVLIRRHSESVRRLCAAWQHEIDTGSRRDQISFDYVCARQQFAVFDLPGTTIRNPFFLWVYHDAGRGELVPVVEAACQDS